MSLSDPASDPVSGPTADQADADTAGTVEAAGHFRIYLGAAAGVGKTYAMLSEGRRRKERGTDVVIGFVEPHGRRHTAEMIVGLETVPRKADQIELVDSSPEQLRRRMLHGNIYPPEKVPKALANFFRTDNLIALRELALRFLADETDDELLERLPQHEARGVWETCERLMVAVTGAPGTDALLRRAARMATRLKGELDVVHITPTDATRVGGERTIEQLKQLAADVDARWHDLKGDDPARVIADFARTHQITQIVIGSSQRSRWQQLVGGGSNVAKVLHEAGPLGIDVHVIALNKSPRASVVSTQAGLRRPRFKIGQLTDVSHCNLQNYL